jgi:hypothetical protein
VSFLRKTPGCGANDIYLGLIFCLFVSVDAAPDCVDTTGLLNFIGVEGKNDANVVPVSVSRHGPGLEFFF